MCCLKHEQNAYEDLLKITPKVSALVALSDGTKGKVVESNPLTGVLKVLTDKSEIPVKTIRDEVTLLKDSRIKVNNDELRALRELEGQ